MANAVFVTGGSDGTGLAVAKRFAKGGFDVIITSRDAERAAQGAKEISDEFGVYSKGYGLDIRDESKVIDVFNDIDANGHFVETVCFNSADQGIGPDPSKGLPMFEMTIEQFQRVVDTNVIWNFMIARQAALRMKEQHKGQIVFIGSNTSYRPIPNRVAYIASKGGINSMSKALAIDLGPYGIRSNVVLPGTIKTKRWKAMGNKQIVNGRFTPIGDISEYEDIAEAVWYFGTEASRNVTGSEIIIDGGMSAQLYPTILTGLYREWRDKNLQ